MYLQMTNYAQLGTSSDVHVQLIFGSLFPANIETYPQIQRWDIRVLWIYPESLLAKYSNAYCITHH